MRVLVVSAIASLAAAQATYSNGTFTCAKPGAAYCAGDSLSTDIIIRCDENGKGIPGRCEDNLAGQPPLGVNPALCWQKDKTSGIAACEKNCVVYGGSGSYNGTFTLGSDVCTPYSTAPTTTPTSTSGPTGTETCTDETETTKTTETTTCTDEPETTKTYTHESKTTWTGTETCTDEPETTTTKTYTHKSKTTWTGTETCTDEPETATTKTYTHKSKTTWTGTESCTEGPTVIVTTTSRTTEIPLSTGTAGTGTYHHHPTGGHNTTVTTATTPCSSCIATNVPPTPTTSPGHAVTTSTSHPVTVNGAGKVASGMFVGLGLLVAALL